MKKILSLALLIAGLAAIHQLGAKSIESDTPYRLIASPDRNMYFALYDTKTGKRTESIRPERANLKQEGGTHGYKLNASSGDRFIFETPRDGSILVVFSHQPKFPLFIKELNKNNFMIIDLDEDTGLFIKAFFNPGRNALSRVISFDSYADSEKVTDDELVNPENNVTAMEWVRRYNAGQPVPKGRAQKRR